jgi:hypothetical protein
VTLGSNPNYNVTKRWHADDRQGVGVGDGQHKSRPTAGEPGFDAVVTAVNATVGYSLATAADRPPASAATDRGDAGQQPNYSHEARGT